MTTSIRLIIAGILMGVNVYASELTLTIAPRAEDQSLFKLGNVYAGKAKGGFYSPSMLRYYISGITLHLRDGKNLTFPDTYILVDIRDVQRFPIGNADVSVGIDSISFHIGVDKARNHLDPTTYPDWHPLALKNPSMHWGWAAGYRFVTYEGKAGTSAGAINATFQIHTLDDKLYTRCSVPLGGMISTDIPLIGNYERLLNNIDISRGLINHGSEDEAATFMANMGSAQNPVYTASLPTSVDEESRSVAVFPNPASDVITLPVGVVRVEFVDIHGASLQTVHLGQGVNVVSVSALAQGTYQFLVHYQHGTTERGALTIIR
ncbi:MAG: MbnP family protein [Ignavibacteria bacterium]